MTFTHHVVGINAGTDYLIESFTSRAAALAYLNYCNGFGIFPTGAGGAISIDHMTVVTTGPRSAAATPLHLA
jgi:hypothetical protein